MTDGQNWGQVPQYPQQGYGQQYPQGQPWQPGQYDPYAHQQRMGGQQSAPQAPAWDQPGYGQPASPSRQPHRRSRSRWPVYTGLGALLVIAAGGTAYALAGHGSTAAPLAAAVAKTETCKQQYAAWKASPAKAGADKMIADLQKMDTAANAEDIPETDADLKAAGNDSAALRAYPMPACADPAGYWPQTLTDIKSAGDNAGSAGGLGGMILAMEPLKKVPPLEAKLKTELKRTTAH